MSILPKVVCFKSEKNKKYLRYKSDKTLTRSFLKFDGDDVMDSYAQFEVSDAIVGGGLVHLKCRYTNLYLARWSRTHYWISASTYEPNEDQTSWGCTLFKPVLVQDFGNTKTIRLLHVQLEGYVCNSKSTVIPSYESCLLVDLKEPDQDSFDLLTAVDWNSLFKLPKRVAFKGDNGLYLGPMLSGGRPALKFEFHDVKDHKVAHEIISFPDGTISIKSEYFKSFWRILMEAEQKFIVVDGDRPSGTGTFRAIPVDIGVFAFMCMNPSLFLKRYDHGSIGWPNTFAAMDDNISIYVLIKVVDLDQFQPPTQATTTSTTELPAI